VIVMSLFVFATGLRGTAWTSVVKDAIVLGAVAFAGIALPIHFFGSPAAVIANVLAAHPGWLTLKSTGTGYTAPWFVSTVLLQGVTFFLWPQTISATYSAKSAGALRRNAVFLPVYGIMLVLMLFAGLTALLLVPGLKGAEADKSFMLVVAKYYPPWVLGAIAGAGCLAAAGLVVKNVMEDALGWKPQEAQRTMPMRILVVILAAAALTLWALFKPTLVELLLIGYNGIAQFIPGVLFAFAWRRATAWGVGAGIAAGLAVLAAAAQEQTLFGINTGVVALAANFIVAVLVSFATPAPAIERVEQFRAAALSDS
jgi:SSS family solute:Na+ symporter